MAKPEREYLPDSSRRAPPPEDDLRGALEEIARLASRRRAGAMGEILAIATVALEKERGA